MEVAAPQDLVPQPLLGTKRGCDPLAIVAVVGAPHRVRHEHVRRGDAHPRVPFTVDLNRLGRLLGLGAPAASQITLEVGVFALATALAARLDAVSSASHQIALNIVSLVFMVPLGLASSGAVRVGHAIGGRDIRRARRAGWTALGVGAVIMIALGIVLFAFRVHC